MKVADRLYVAIDYKLTLDSGEVVDKSEPGEPLGFIFGSGGIIKGLERAIEGKEAGDSLEVEVAPEDGYGHSKEEMLRDIPKDNFPDDLELNPGMGFQANGPHGPVTFRIRDVKDEVVVADFNHPLAGETLHFDVTINEVREPQAEELASLMSQEGCSPTDCGSCGGSCG